MIYAQSGIFSNKHLNRVTTSIIVVTTQPHSHEHQHLQKHKHPHADAEGELSSMTRVQRLAMFLEAHFGEVEFHQPEEEGNRSADSEEGERSDDEEASLLVRLDEADARISLISLVSKFCFFFLWLGCQSCGF